MEEKTVIQESKKISKAPLAILFTFLILTILGLAVLVVGVKTNWDFKSFDFKTLFTKVVEEEQEDAEEVNNEGWGIFKLPDYAFSVEIPDYKYKQSLGVGNDKRDVNSYWSVRHAERTGEDDEEPYYILSDYKDSVGLFFYPTDLPDSVACGQGCVNEHFFDIDIYENSDKKDLAGAKAILEENLDDRFEISNNAAESSYEGEITQKWGMDVLEYHMEFIGGDMDGYLVVTEDFVYHIMYYLAQSPKASNDIALLVIDSMSFGE